MSATSRRQWPAEGIARVPYWVYTDPEIYAREQERIFGGRELELRRARGGDPERRRLQAHLHRRQAGRRRARRRRRRQRRREPLRASRRAVLPARISAHATEFMCPYHQWTYDLQGQPDRRAVPARRAAAGRHAGRLRARASTGCDGCRSHARHGVVFASFARRGRAARGLSRRVDAAATSTASSTAARCACSATCASASRQLEADVREHQGPVPRQPAARVPGDLRPVPRRPARPRCRWTRPAATRA